MAEEFEESEVVFKEEEDGSKVGENYRESVKRKKVREMSDKNSVPVSIPEGMYRNSWLRWEDLDFDGSRDEELVPPHIIMRRRVAEKMMAFSVCTGNGRTLKGRDLSAVRNSILRMTGFLET